MNGTPDSTWTSIRRDAVAERLRIHPAEPGLKPEVRVPAAAIGEGTTVAFRFHDDRDDVTVGDRSVATVGAKISA